MQANTGTRNWKLLYTDYSGLAAKALQFLSRELSAYLLRDPGVYTVHVLPCEREETAAVDTHAVVVSTYEKSPLIQAHIRPEEIPEDGYVIKITDNPTNPTLKLVLLTARDPQALFYAAVDFIDDALPVLAPYRGKLEFPDQIFEEKLPDYYAASAPAVKKRSVFTWGHPINDYREYIDNLARLKFNQLIVWNDFVPLNAREIVEYAHSYGIQFIWGYAWGWETDCRLIDFAQLEALSAQVLTAYEAQYRDTGADGIYFQSFTELKDAYIGEHLIAEAVVDFVNSTAEKFLSKYPGLFIQFGLHASSVKDHLSFIAKTDPRVEILWEDCGTFPYSDEPTLSSAEEYARTEALTDAIVALRAQGTTGMLYKGNMRLDWTHFAHQKGPFIMGESSKVIIENDLRMLRPMWRHFQINWYQNGEYAHRMTQRILKSGKEEITLGVAGQFAGGIWFSEALCAQIFWDGDRPYSEILEKVSRRRCIQMV